MDALFSKISGIKILSSFILAGFLFSSLPVMPASAGSEYKCVKVKKDKKKKKSKKKNKKCYSDYGYNYNYYYDNQNLNRYHGYDSANPNGTPFTRRYVRDYTEYSNNDDWWW